MKRNEIVKLVVPCVVHVALSTATIVLAAEVLKRVNSLHKDVKLLGEKHGLLKLAVKVLSEKEKRDEKRDKKEEKKAKHEQKK